MGEQVGKNRQRAAGSQHDDRGDSEFGATQETAPAHADHANRVQLGAGTRVRRNDASARTHAKRFSVLPQPSPSLSSVRFPF